MFYVTPRQEYKEKSDRAGYSDGEQYFVIAVDFQQDRNPRFLVANDEGIIKATSSEMWLYDGQKRRTGTKQKE